MGDCFDDMDRDGSRHVASRGGSIDAIDTTVRSSPLSVLLPSLGVASVVMVVLVGLLIWSEGSGQQPEHMDIAVPRSGVLSRSGEAEQMQRQVLDRVRHALETNAEEGDSREVVERSVSASERVDALRAGEAVVTVGCVGELLERLDGHRAGQLQAQFAHDSEFEEEDARRDAAHRAMAASLPPELAASNPGINELCEGENLPQNLVVIYREDVLNRNDVAALNALVGSD